MRALAALTTVAAVTLTQAACGHNQAAVGLPPTAGSISAGEPAPRTLNSVTSSYTSAVVADSPALYFRLDQSSGTTVTDSSGHGRTGTLWGNVTYRMTGASGDSDTALGFNGSSTYIVATVPNVGSNYSLEGWFKTSSSAEQDIIDVYPQALRVVGGRVSFGTGSTYLQSPSSGYDDGRYHHVVATYDGSTKRLYLDGILVTYVSSKTGAIASSTANIGHYFYGGSLFNGSLDEIALYGGVLSSSAVLAHYRAVNGTTGGSSVPKHVLTADYDLGNTSLSASARAPYVNWLSTTFQSNPTVRAAGIKAMYYSNPNRILTSQSIWPYLSGNEKNFAHDCAGNRIRSDYYGGEYLTDPGVSSSSTVKQGWRSYIADHTDSEHQWDAIFEDGTNNAIQSVHVMPCGYSETSWTNASIAEANYQSPTKIIVNGFGLGTAMDASSDVMGGMLEGSYGGGPLHPEMWAPYWTTAENEELNQARIGKLFISLSQNITDAASSSASRIFSYASFLMTYDAATSVYWTTMTTPSGFHVLPESRLVPTTPLVSAPSDISALQIAGGVYGREYSKCYVWGSLIGACAVVVNPDRYNSHSYPYGHKYAHTLTLLGSGVLDGGSISTNGPAPPTSLSHLTAVIVFQ